MNCIYSKIRKQVLQYFREKKCENEVAVKIVDSFTTVIEFVDEQILVSVEIIKQVISETLPTIWHLNLFIGSCGKTLLKFKYDGDEFVIHRVAANLRESLDGMIGGYNNEIGRNTQVGHLV